MKYLICLLAALLLVGARPLPASPSLPPARLAVPARPAVAVLQPTPAVTISGVVEGRTSGGSPAPIGAYVAYGATIGEAAVNAEALDQQVRMEATARAVTP